MIYILSLYTEAFGSALFKYSKGDIEILGCKNCSSIVLTGWKSRIACKGCPVCKNKSCLTDVIKKIPKSQCFFVIHHV